MSAQVESTLDAMKAKLDAQLNAKIDAINATITDTWTLDHPTAIEVGAAHDWAYPYVVLVPDESAPENDAASDIVWLHVIRTVCFVSEFDTRALLRKLIRMQRAVREVCLAQRQPGVNIGDGGWGINHLRDEYGPAFQPEPDAEFVQGVASLFQVRQGQQIS